MKHMKVAFSHKANITLALLEGRISVRFKSN